MLWAQTQPCCTTKLKTTSEIVVCINMEKYNFKLVVAEPLPIPHLSYRKKKINDIEWELPQKKYRDHPLAYG